MKTRKYMTLVLMPPNPGRNVIRVSLPSFMAIFLVLLLGAFLSFAFAGVWSYFHYNEVADKSRSLEEENRVAKTQMEDQKQKIDLLNRELAKIKEKTGYIQNFLGLKPQQGSASGKIGQGGIEISPQMLPDRNSNLGEEVQPLRPESIDLERLISLQDVDRLDMDLQRIVAALQSRQEKLDRTPFISPVDPQACWISSPFGTRISPFTGKPQFHLGIDMAGCEGTPILAPAAGRVAFADKNGLLGLTLKLAHDSTYETVYGHLDKLAVKKGQTVQRGQVIGYMGSSGRSTGYHLHYEVKRNGKSINPFEHMLDWQDNKLLMAAN
jgi:murein DD-endopeptidase MepM/ murein hydrolase activator NlpD